MSFIEKITNSGSEAYHMLFSHGPVTGQGVLFLLALVIILYILVKMKFSGGLVRSASHRVIPKDSRDTPRLFTEKQKRNIHYRARRHRGSKYGTCEWIVMGVFSCSNKSTQADHWFPHANGGKTTMKNAVALCKQHNGRKSNHIPSWWLTTRIAHRRKRYYHFNDERRPGEWMNGREKQRNKRRAANSSNMR